jgi:MoaA/NifB/PqqE/SkfB family radical SAM enzyme
MENIEIKELKFEIEPKILTLVVTYKCSASCNNCCFSCNPDRNEFLSKKDAIEIITESVENFPKLSLLVITGGEPLLQGTEYLTSIIQHAKKSKLHTRLVTN